MNTLSKTQVLALFLGTSSAATLTAIELLNGPSDVAKVPDAQTLTTSNSGTSCNGNADCTKDSESCGNFQEAGKTATNFCIATSYCGSLGRLNGTAWSIQCWATPEADAAATAPAAVDATQYMKDLEPLITKEDSNAWGAVGSEIQNLWVSPLYNFQDGWWAETADGKFKETDKESDNRCFENEQCPTDECCATFPDTNNRRCTKRTNDKKELFVGPVKIIPQCAIDADSDVVPGNAIDDIAKGALAEASEELGKFYDNQLTDAKTAAGYDTMDAESKAAFDAQQTANADKRKALFTELKTLVGYETDKCDDACKADFEAELLKWGKAMYTTCKDDAKGIACREAFKIKKDEATARAGGEGKKNFYTEMSAEERLAFEKARKDQVSALESSLAAAWIKDHAPSAGEAGSSCAGELKCTFEGHCCGKSTRVDGAFVNEPLESICADKTTLKFSDDLGREYTHVCELANKLMVGTAAVLATLSLM